MRLCEEKVVRRNGGGSAIRPVVIVIVVFCLAACVCLAVWLFGNLEGQSDRQQLVYGKESRFAPIPEDMKFGNVRYLHLTRPTFKKPETPVPGLSDESLVGHCRTYAVALTEPNLHDEKGTRYDTILINLDGEMNFEDSQRVIQLKPGFGIQRKVIDNKEITFGVLAPGRYQENVACIFSIVPVYQAPLNIGGEKIVVVGASLDGNMDFSPGKDKLVIHKPVNPGERFRKISVYDVEVDRAFQFGKGDQRGWYELNWDQQKKSLRVVKSKPSMGFLASSKDWTISLKPGDMSFKGSANEKTAVPAGDYSVDSMGFKHGEARLVEFDYHLCKDEGLKTPPEIHIKSDETFSLEPINEIKPWFEHGWHKNELTVVMGFTNSRRAGNMGVSHQGKPVVWEYEVVRADSGQQIAIGQMAYG